MQPTQAVRSQVERRGMAAARRPGRLLPPGGAYGWSDLIFTHISARVPGPEHHFLINPYGLMFDEITASSLVKVDRRQQGDRLAVPGQPGRFRDPQRGPRSPRRRRCVLHTHTRAGVACQRAEVRHPADLAAVDLRARVAGLSRLRRRGVRRRGKAAAAGRPRRQQLPDAAQPRPADRRHDGRRCVPVDVHVREHLPDPDGRAGRRRADALDPRIVSGVRRR